MVNIDPNIIDTKLTKRTTIITLLSKSNVKLSKKNNRNPIIAILGIVLRNGSMFIGADSYVSATQKWNGYRAHLKLIVITKKIEAKIIM